MNKKERTRKHTDYNKTDTSLIGAVFVLFENIEPLALRRWRISNLELGDVLFSFGNILPLLFLGLLGGLGCWLFAR